MNVPLPLRDDLVIKEQIVNQAKTFIIKDPVKQSYSRFEEEEFYVLSLIDGKRNVKDIADAFNDKFDGELEGKDVAEFIASLRSNDLFQRSKIQQNIFLYEQLMAQRKRRIALAKGSPLYFRIPAFDPNAFFDKIIPYIKWIWSPQCVALSILFMLSAVAVLIVHSSQVQAGVQSTFNFLNQDIGSLVVLWATVMIVIMIHELGHGLTCKRFGGECHEIGFLFMFFTPCMYANVNDAWLFDNKRHRLYVTFAGCYIEIFVGSIAVYVWLLTQHSSLINILAFKVIVVCFFSAIFMNFNPLMKFDGYFALSDFLEVPNLRNRSREYVGYLIQRHILRLQREYESLTKREQWILGIYGVLSTLYIINVMFGLMGMVGGALIKQFKVAGIILTSALIIKFFGPVVKKYINNVKVAMIEHKAFLNRGSVRIVSLMILTVVLGVSVFMPFPYHYKTHATLEPSREAIIRTLASGYVTSMTHPHKRRFKKGDVILVQESEELSNQEKTHLMDMETNKLMLQGAHASEKSADIQKITKLGQKLEDKLQDLQRQKNNLTLVAPFKGILVKNLAEVEHTFIDKGEEVGRLIDTSVYCATFDVPQRDMKGIEENMEALLMLKAKAGDIFKGQVVQISSQHQVKGLDRVYRVTVDFPNEKESLRSGLEGEISINTGRYTVPQRIAKWLRKVVRLDLQI